jgi:hypothetical protein
MNTNESEFETQLRSLKPVAPSPELAERIAAELRTVQSVTVAPARAIGHVPAAGSLQPQRAEAIWIGLLRRLLWAGVGAAAAVIVLSARAPQAQPLAPAAPTTLPIESTAAPAAEESSELIAATSEGVLLNGDSSEPQQQMRLTYLERHVWTNPQTGAVIEFEVPREDVVLMPVAMQ